MVLMQYCRGWVDPKWMGNWEVWRDGTRGADRSQSQQRSSRCCTLRRSSRGRTHSMWRDLEGSWGHAGSPGWQRLQPDPGRWLAKRLPWTTVAIWKGWWSGWKWWRHQWWRLTCYDPCRDIPSWTLWWTLPGCLDLTPWLWYPLGCQEKQVSPRQRWGGRGGWRRRCPPTPRRRRQTCGKTWVLDDPASNSEEGSGAEEGNIFEGEKELL